MKQFKRPVIMVLPALLFTLLYGAVLGVAELRHQGLTGGMWWGALLFDLVFAFAYVWALFFSMRFLGRTVFRILLLFFFLTAALVTYYIHVFQIGITQHMIAVTVEAEPTLILQFLSLSLCIWLVLAAAAAWFSARVCIAREEADPRDKMVLLVSGMFVFTAFFMDGGVSRQYLPYNYLLATADYVNAQLKPEAQRRDLAKEQAQLRPGLPEHLVAVLVIGESARPDHFGLLGYGRDTTPLLGKTKNLTAYGNVPSCGPFTRDAVPCIMTRASYMAPEKAQAETSFLRMFGALGFHTVWVDMQGSSASVFDTRITQIIHEANEAVTFNTQLLDAPQKDEAVLPVLERVLAEQKGRVLIVLHLFGSHWPYDARGGEAFEKFTPTCSAETPLIGDFRTSEDMASCPRAQLVNAYDNSILYTDYVLAEVVARLKHRPAFMVYTSDHGESLGEDGYFLHGNTTPEGLYVTAERRVPVLLWHSESYPLKPVKEAITHDYMFHSMLDCAGVESPVVNKDLSLCM